MEKGSALPDTTVLLLSTTPDGEVARTISRALVEEGLAACVNFLPGITSVYRWRGAVETNSEHLLLIKTRSGQVDGLLKRLPALHPYDVPEVITLPITSGYPPYLQWILDSTGAGQEDG